MRQSRVNIGHHREKHLVLLSAADREFLNFLFTRVKNGWLARN